MDSGRSSLRWSVALLLLLDFMGNVRGNLVFDVQKKYRSSDKKKVPLSELRAHDSRRHGRSLAAVDLELGGDGSPTSAALYFTKVTIGNPPVDFHIQMDTGSDILWVSCKNCENCPSKTDLKIELHQYDMSASSTGKAITCDQEFCATVFNNAPMPNCKSGMNCEYSVSYGDGSRTDGYFVRDDFKLNQVTGNHQTTAMTGSVGFGCSFKQSGDTASSAEAVDGIVGFGQANTSLLSQLSSAGKVRKIFSHCLDGKKGGGIFTIGEVEEPKFNTTPLVPNQPHYNAELSSIEVGNAKLKLPWDLFGLAPSKKAVIDSGSTLAYLPADIYKQVVEQMFANQQGLSIYVIEGQFKCFKFSGNVDDAFPVVKFTFKSGLPLPVYPHEYLFDIDDGEYCIGWQNNGMQTKEGEEMTLLGDLALSNKLVVYDLEKQVVGWTDHDCATSIKVKDSSTGAAYEVAAKNLNNSPVLRANAALIVLYITTFLLLIIQ